MAEGKKLMADHCLVVAEFVHQFSLYTRVKTLPITSVNVRGFNERFEQGHRLLGYMSFY